VRVRGIEEGIAQDKVIVAQTGEEKLHPNYLPLMIHLKLAIIFNFPFPILHAIYVVNGEQSA
jgi:hypothetical protein